MASHNYLTGIREVGVRARSTGGLMEGETIINLILLPLRNVVLFPNESVPLRIRNRSYIAAIGSMLRGDEAPGAASSSQPSHLHLGIVNLGDHSPISVGYVGTTSEIRAASSSSSSEEEIILRAKGRHRFVLLDKVRSPTLALPVSLLLDLATACRSTLLSNTAHLFTHTLLPTHPTPHPSPHTPPQPRKEQGVYLAKVLILNETLPKYDNPAPGANPFPSWAYRRLSVNSLLSTAMALFESTHSFTDSTPVPESQLRLDRLLSR